MHQATHAPHPVDLHVGARIRTRRRELGISQTQLAGPLDLTFQQVQKYERGANRVSASKLFDMSAVLSVPVSWFFAGLPTPDQNPDVSRIDDISTRLMASPDGLEIARAVTRLKPRFARHLARLATAMAEDADADTGAAA